MFRMKENINNKIIVVTGGAGFIGSHVCDRLIKYNPEQLIIIDDFSLGKKRNIKQLLINENVIVKKIDASNYTSMLDFYNKEKIDVTFNFAVVPLPASLSEPKHTLDVNILITTTLCELLRLGKFNSLIHISSSEAYGTSVYQNKPMDEKHPTYPITPYAASKLACDHIALSYYRTFGCDISIARPFNAYGPRQNERSYAGVIPLTISRILRGDAPVIHGNGLQTRDYTFVKDIADAIPNFYETSSTRGKIINIASGKEITIKRLIHEIIDLMGYKGPVIKQPRRPGDVNRHLGDISLANELLGYKPKTEIRTGLKETIDWYKKTLNQKSE